jgi:hypothetical protein
MIRYLMIQVFEGGIYSISSLPDLLAIKVGACQLVKNNFFTKPALLFVYPYMCNIVLAYTHYQCIHVVIHVLFRCIYHVIMRSICTCCGINLECPT